jgi:hypothetical protein
MRDRWRTFDRVIRETFCVGELQKFIKLPLITDGAAQSRSDVGPAGRTGAVIGIDHHVIGQLQIKVMQGMELLFRELFCVFLA